MKILRALSAVSLAAALSVGLCGVAYAGDASDTTTDPKPPASSRPHAPVGHPVVGLPRSSNTTVIVNRPAAPRLGAVLLPGQGRRLVAGKWITFVRSSDSLCLSRRSAFDDSRLLTVGGINRLNRLQADAVLVSSPGGRVVTVVEQRGIDAAARALVSYRTDYDRVLGLRASDCDETVSASLVHLNPRPVGVHYSVGNWRW